MNSQDITKIILAALAIFTATSFCFALRIRKSKKDSNNRNNITQNGMSFGGDVNQSGRDNNVRKR